MSWTTFLRKRIVSSTENQTNFVTFILSLTEGFSSKIEAESIILNTILLSLIDNGVSYTKIIVSLLRNLNKLLLETCHSKTVTCYHISFLVAY